MFLPPGFDKAIASEAGKLVSLAYDQYTKFKNGQNDWTLPSGYQNMANLEASPDQLTKKEPFGFVARNLSTGNVFVTFRGTESPADWMSDLNFPQVPHTSWGKVEEGFWKLHLQCTVSVKYGVNAAGAAPQVFVTGHSLGGALAVLAAADLIISGVAPNNIMYSFAGPRVGDLDFAAKFADARNPAWRVVNTEDVVPTVPLATPELLTGAPIPHNPLGMVLMLAHSLNFEHIGVPVCFTQHKGSIPGNHAMALYQAQVDAS
jgi:hypothetical protein